MMNPVISCMVPKENDSSTWNSPRATRITQRDVGKLFWLTGHLSPQLFIPEDAVVR
jgi:hypothetical protein